VSDEFAQLFLRHTVFQGTRQMTSQLIGPLQSNQRRACDKAPVAFGELWTFPYVAEKNLFGELGQLRHYRPNSLQG
jgi:hypothetical protein